jgi:hypothetical protein
LRILSFGGSDGVEILVNILRDTFDLSVKFILNCKQILLVILSDEIDSHTKMTKSTRSTNSVKICFSILGEVKVDNNVHSLNIDTSCEDICADKASCFTVFEIMEHSKFE